MKKVNMEVEKIKIQINSENCLYITIGDWTYYIDDSTNEQIMSRWNKYNKLGDDPSEDLNYNKTLVKNYSKEFKGLHRWKELNECKPVQYELTSLVNSIASHSGLYCSRELVRQLQDFGDKFSENCRLNMTEETT